MLKNCPIFKLKVGVRLKLECGFFLEVLRYVQRHANVTRVVMCPLPWCERTLSYLSSSVGVSHCGLPVCPHKPDFSPLFQVGKTSCRSDARLVLNNGQPWDLRSE